MKLFTLRGFGLAWLFICLGITGCQTDESNPAGVHGSVKTQGVYATLAIPNPGLDLPGSGYVQRISFGPGESPAAVVAGYGGYNQHQLLTLKLIELSTGRVLLSRDYYATYGKVIVQPLAIRLSGTYELKLATGGTALDTCHFTVARAAQSGSKEMDTANAGSNYAEGSFAVSVDPESLPDYFADYNDKLNYRIVNAVSRAAGGTNGDLFAQRFAGKVVIKCRLDAKGRITEPRIPENSLDDQCGELLIKALIERSPYSPRPEDMHQKLGADDHEIKLTIYSR